MIIGNWKSVLKDSMVVWVAVAGAILPELPDLTMRWLADPSSEILSPATKNWIRGLLMFFVIPMVRIWHQQRLHETPAPEPITVKQALKGQGE